MYKIALTPHKPNCEILLVVCFGGLYFIMAFLNSVSSFEYKIIQNQVSIFPKGAAMDSPWGCSYRDCHDDLLHANVYHKTTRSRYLQPQAVQPMDVTQFVRTSLATPIVARMDYG